MEHITQAKENAKNRAEKWQAVADGIKEVMKLVDRKIGDDAVTTSDSSFYPRSNRVTLTIVAEVDDPQDGAFDLIETRDWDHANIKKQRTGYEVQVEADIRGR